MLAAVFESVLLSVLSIYLLLNYGHDAITPTFWETGALCFTAIVMVTNIKVRVCIYIIIKICDNHNIVIVVGNCHYYYTMALP